MLSLITSILDLSKIEAGKFTLTHTNFDLRRLVEDVAYMMGAVAAQKGLRLSLTLSSNLPAALVGDPLRLSQILNNLIDNAIKFTDEGSIAVSAALQEATAESALIHFEVRDTGIGILPEDQAIIFDAFSQAIPNGWAIDVSNPFFPIVGPISTDGLVNHGPELGGGLGTE